MKPDYYDTGLKFPIRPTDAVPAKKEAAHLNTTGGDTQQTETLCGTGVLLSKSTGRFEYSAREFRDASKRPSQACRCSLQKYSATLCLCLCVCAAAAEASAA